jgi:hypothetical protein
MHKRIIRAVKNPRLVAIKIMRSSFFNRIPDNIYLKIQYKLHIGKSIDFKNPKTFNEKLQWLKLYDRKPEYTRYVDKYEVRPYISQTIGEEYLIPLLGVYNSVDEIDFDKLPNQFVLKCTHGSHCNIICTNKDELDIEEAKKKLSRWMKKSWFWFGREWPYRNLKPRIICEKFLEDETSNGLIDYKFMCFNGQAKCIFVCSNRNSATGTNIDIYDMDWELIPCEREINTASNSIISKPTNFDLMVKYAEILAKNIPFVRVDFYEVEKKLYFGEITFFPAAGFERFVPDSYDDLFGSWISLNEVSKK